MNSDKQNHIPQMLTIEQAAKESNLCSSTVRRMCCQGKVCTIKTGKKWLINKDSFVEFLIMGGKVN